MIIDAKCTECGAVQEDLLVRREEELPACKQCGGRMERMWTLRKPKEGEAANHSSVRFHFNYMEP